MRKRESKMTYRED